MSSPSSNRRAVPARRVGIIAAGPVVATLAVLRPWDPGAGRDAPPGTATVIEVVDGDTLVVDLDGHEEHVRLIGIDTPETVHPDRPEECYGAEASDNLAELVPPGSVVRLERDVEARDMYDRLLAYVHRTGDGLLVNLAQVADGYAETLAYPPNTAHSSDFEDAQRRARTAGAGLWTACGSADVPIDQSRASDSLASMATLAERLGYGPDDRVLIINCDDLGSCHAANVGVYEALRDGIGTSASLMVPCPWAREAAGRYRGEDVGVHLTLNAEHDLYRWGPITHAPSLLDGDGGFPRTQRDLWDHADLDEARRELRAQVERAILWGFDVSHLDSHMGTLQLRAEFFDIYLDLAVDFGLPIRLSGASTERTIGFPFRKLADEEGVVFPDHFVYVRSGVGSRRDIERTVHDLQPGVTELYVHPAVDSPELRALTPDWAARVDDHDLVVTDHSLRAMLERAGAHLIGYRELRDLQRRG